MLPAAPLGCKVFQIFPVRKASAARILARTRGEEFDPARALPAPRQCGDEAMDFSTAHWAVPSKSNARLHVLWMEHGPPVCQRKQASHKEFKAMFQGAGFESARQAGIEFCPSCVRKRNIVLQLFFQSLLVCSSLRASATSVPFRAPQFDREHEKSLTT